MTLTEFVGRFENPKTKGLFIYVHCPAHNGDAKTRKLALWEEAGWIKMKCWSSGCSDQDIIATLGLTNDDLRTTSGKHTAYVYCDEQKKPLFRKTKTFRGDKKSYAQEGYKDGKWVGSKAHLNGKSTTLYRLAEVLDAVKTGQTIYVNEGEKACEAIRAEGGVATCQPEGGNVGAWTSAHSAVLRGADVTIIADRDDKGAQYARSVYGSLRGVAARVRVVRSKADAEKADAFDHLAAEFTLNDFEPAPELEVCEEPPSVFRLLDVDEVLSMPPKKFLVEGLLGERDRGMIFGPPASAKTAIVVDLILALTLGGVFAGQFNVTRPCRVVYCTNEGKFGFPARLRAALSHNGETSDAMRGMLVTLFDMPQIFDEESERRLDVFSSEWIRSGRGPLDLIIFDTLNKASLGGEESSNDDAARACDNLARLGETLGCGSQLVHHSPHDADRPRGASAYIGDMDLIVRSDYKKEQREGTLSCFKGKDIEPFSPIGYKLVPALDSIAISWGFGPNSDATFNKAVLEMQSYSARQIWWNINELSIRIGADVATVRRAFERELEKGKHALIVRDQNATPIKYCLRKFSDEALL